MSLLQLQDGWVDLDRRIVCRLDRPDQSLTTREATLLAVLAETPGRVLSKADILQRAWGYSEQARTRTVDTTLSRLRAAIERDASAPTHLLTLRGQGLYFRPAIGSVSPDPNSPDPAPLLAALDRGHTLITVHGPPAAGKSHLVWNAMTARQTPFAWLDLSAPHGPIASHVSTDSRVLVLDQAHSDVEAAFAFAQPRPNLVLVVTSSSALALRGEQRLWLPSTAPDAFAQALERCQSTLSAAAQQLLRRLQTGEPLSPADLVCAADLSRHALLDPAGQLLPGSSVEP